MGSVDRTGDDVQLSADREVQGWPRLSPDGRRLALQRIDALRGNPDIWVKDLERGTEVRITTAVEPELLPVWSPDGNRLEYVTGPPAGRAGKRDFYIAAADGTGIIRTVPCPGEYCEPTDWTQDGQLIVNVRDARGQDVWSIATEGADSSRPLLAQPFIERDARISRDGSIAYVSEESGRPEVSVQNLSASPARTVISVGGGNQPVWNRNGSELFFVDLQGRLKSVSIVSWAGPRFSDDAFWRSARSLESGHRGGLSVSLLEWLVNCAQQQSQFRQQNVLWPRHQVPALTA